MRIQIITQYFSPEPFRINDIVIELVSQGHEVSVLTGLPNYPEGKVLEDYKKSRHKEEDVFGAKVYRVSLIGRGKGLITLLLNYISFAVNARIKAQKIDRKSDVVLIMQYSPIFVCHAGYAYARRSKSPVFLYCLDLWPESINARLKLKKSSPIYKLLVRYCAKLYQKSDTLAITSRLFENYFRNQLNIDKPLMYLPQFAENIFKAAKYPENEIFKVVFAGNIGKAQSVDTIIRAANILKNNKNILFEIVGAGSALKQCNQLAKELDIKDTVKFYGRHPLQDMPFFYDNANVLLVTLAHNDIISLTLPGKVQTYMAAGRPIICTAEGECARVISTAKCGIVCSSEDYTALAKGVLKLYEDREQAVKFGENARRYYDSHFTKEMFFDKLTNKLQSMVNEVRDVQEQNSSNNWRNRFFR